MPAERKKKVLIVITKSNWGGAQAYVYSLALGLKRHGYDVIVAAGGGGTPGEPGLLVTRLQAAGIECIYMRSIARDIGFGREFRAYRELYSLLKRERPDILHVNSSKAGALGALAGRMTSIKTIVFTVHGWPHRERRSLLTLLFIRAASWITILLSHQVIAVSAFDQRDAPVLFGRKKIQHIANGITPFALKQKEDARHTLAPGLSTTATWLCMLAELHPNKGIDTALYAFARVKDAYPDAVLVIVGDGELREPLQKHTGSLGLTGRVCFSGFIANAREYLSAADILLFPSRKEGLPLTLLEAGMASLPVIASDTGGVSEIIKDKKTGLLIPHDDVETLCAAIRALLDDPGFARMLGTNLHTHVQEHFSEEKMISGTIEVYNRSLTA